MPAIAYALRLLAFTFGACLDVLLIVVLVRKGSGGLSEKLAAATLAATALWHGANSVAMFRGLNGDAVSVPLLATVAGVALAPALLLHAGTRWANLTNWLAAPGYLITPLIGWALWSDEARICSSWIAVTLTATAALSLYTATRRSQPYERLFFRVFAGAVVAIPIVAGLAGTNSAAPALASIAPPFAFAWFVYRYHVLDLLIGRRVVLALNLGVLFVFCLLLIRGITRVLEDSYGVTNPLTDVALVSSAALLVWSLLYGWMTHSHTKRERRHDSFSKRLIEEAARILDLKKRVQFLAEELGRTFTLRRVQLVAAGDPQDSGDADTHRQIEKLARERHFDVVCTGRAADPEMRRLVGSLGFNYLFPLWYEQRLAGLLFLDTSPRRFLDEDEDMLLGLSREVSHSIETCRVIEEKIGLERALARQEHLASLGRMAATIAHEIKNPLTSVKALAQLMREDPEVREKHDRDLGYMIDEADRLNRSVQQLLSFSPPLPERQQGVDLTGLLEDMAELLARQCAGERIRIEHEIELQLRLERSDPEMVRQIFLNLVLNAIQASEPGGSVRLSAGMKSEGDVIISVSDHGPGIPAGIRDKIFEPFFTTKQRGTGLGLAIVRKNVHDLRGEVEVTSPIAEGRGTRVEVTLPIE